LVYSALTVICQTLNVAAKNGGAFVEVSYFIGISI
jgi:hypothetical protein